MVDLSFVPLLSFFGSSWWAAFFFFFCCCCCCDAPPWMHGTFFIPTFRRWLLARVSFRVSFFRSHPSGTYRRGDQFFIVGTATCGECGASSCFGVADACLGMHVGSHEGRCHGRCSHVGSLVVDAAVVCRDVKCGASSTPIHTDCGHAAQNLPRGVFPPPPHTPHTHPSLSLSSSTSDLVLLPHPLLPFGGKGMEVSRSISSLVFLRFFPWTQRKVPTNPGAVSGLPFLIRCPSFCFFPPHVSPSRVGVRGSWMWIPSHHPTVGSKKDTILEERKKERKKDVRRRRRTESLPNRMEGGRKTQPNHPTNTTRAE